MSGWLIPLVYIIIAGISTGIWYAVPKGPNQTLIRTMMALTMTCCSLMWGITYLAQLHPLVAPRNSKLRPEGDYML